jgi:hypothetical protein
MMPFLTTVIEFIKEWQTLIGALLAIFVAMRTIKVLNLQTLNETNRHLDHQRRKGLAARAEMPDALSEISAYLRAAGEFLIEERTDKPETPSSALSTLKRSIEHLEDGAAKRTFELISFYQVQNVRMENSGGHSSLDDMTYDVIKLQALTNSLFDYARNEERSVEASDLTREEMAVALKNAFRLENRVPLEEEFQLIDKIINRRHA